MKTCLNLMIVLLCCSTLLAQTSQQTSQVQRVDQAVGDLDGLSRSMRQQGAGLRVDGEHTSLFSVPDEKIQQMQVFGQAAQTTGIQHSNAFLRVAPGIMSQSDQMYYVVPSRTKAGGIDSNVAPSVDGAFIEVIPANTVFLLSPQMQNVVRSTDNADTTQQPTNRLEPKRVDNRVDSRMVSRRVDNRYQSTRVDNRVSHMPNQSLHYKVNEPMRKTKPKTNE
tara:strand:+ start:369 stop:1034 length:666 start_codon:yes stop_codon:yes gene_type:complete